MNKNKYTSGEWFRRLMVVILCLALVGAYLPYGVRAEDDILPDTESPTVSMDISGYFAQDPDAEKKTYVVSENAVLQFTVSDDHFTPTGTGTEGTWTVSLLDDVKEWEVTPSWQQTADGWQASVSLEGLDAGTVVTVHALVSDKAGNSEKWYSERFVIDAAPEFLNDWAPDFLQVSGGAGVEPPLTKRPDLEIDENGQVLVRLYVKETLKMTVDCTRESEVIPVTAEKTESGYTLTFLATAKGVYKLTAVDGAGNVTETRVDLVSPVITNDEGSASFPAQWVTSLEEGTLITVSGYCRDPESWIAGDDSMAYALIFYTTEQAVFETCFGSSRADEESYGVPFVQPDEINNSFFFEVESPGTEDFTIWMWTYDDRGNGVMATQEVKMDAGPPTITVTQAGTSYADGSTIQLQSAGKVTVQIKDSGNGLVPEKCSLTVDGKAQTLSSSGTASLQFGGSGFAEGVHTLYVYAEDTRGNKATVKKITVIYDKTAPEAEIEGDESAQNPSIKILLEDAVSGIDEVSVLLQKSGGTGAVSVPVTATLNSSGTQGSAVIKVLETASGIKAGTAGTVYLAEGTYEVTVHVTDKAGNSRDVKATYVVDRSDPGISVSLPRTTLEDEKDLPLYAQAPTATVKVTDDVSGIRQVRWTVTAESGSYTGTSGTVAVSASGTVSGEWKVTGKDGTKVTELQGEIPISGSANGITLWIQLTDQSGNVSEKSVKLSVDTKAPIIEIYYAGGEADTENTSYYSQTRTATVYVREQNFDPEKVTVLVTNEEGEVPVLSQWTKRSASGSSDPLYSATMVFEDDGVYTLSVSATDSAGHRASTASGEPFTIDKTLPEVTVAFDADQAQNGSYYAAGRSATITVTEHNFDEARVQFTDYSGSVTWTHTEDTHTARLTFSQDGTYDFDVAVTDMAGNLGDSYAGAHFTVDTKAPEILLDYGESGASSQVEVTPSVSVTDMSFIRSGVTVTLTKDGETVALSADETETETGVTMVLAEPERIEASDGVYVLTVAAEDLAGNRSESSLTYYINRFGSVYELDEAMAGLLRSHSSQPIELKFREINVNLLDETTIQVRLSHDGVIRTLEKGTDYTVERGSTEEGWCQYDYTVFINCFDGDGVYRLFVQSQDEADNLSDMENKLGEGGIVFVIDSTAPMILVSGLESGAVIAASQADVTVQFMDNLQLQTAEIYVNGELLRELDEDDLAALEGGRTTFTLKESNRKQTVQIVVRDASGNETEQEYTKVMVNTSWIMRFLGAYGTHLLVAAGVIGAAILVISFLRRKKLGSLYR